MFDSKKILDFNSPTAPIDEYDAKVFIFHQRDYYGYYVIDTDDQLQRAMVLSTAYMGFYDDFADFVSRLQLRITADTEIRFILDFNKVGFVPEAYYSEENNANYFKVLTPSRKNVQVRSMASSGQNLHMIYDVNEQIVPVSIVATKFPSVEIMPSSKGMIEQAHLYDRYVNFSLRNTGFYHTYKVENELIDHDYTNVIYEADFLNHILNYVKNLGLEKEDIVIILDGYADMASVLEDRLLNMDFRVARVQTAELDNLPEEFSFLPMYSFFSSYLNIKCEL